MTRVFHPFLAIIASSADRELARYIEYLQEENKILRALMPAVRGSLCECSSGANRFRSVRIDSLRLTGDKAEQLSDILHQPAPTLG